MVFAWHIDVHAPQTSNQRQRNKDGGQERQPVHDIVGHVVGLRQLEVDLRKVICVRSVQNTVVVVDVLHHGHNVVYAQQASDDGRPTRWPHLP